MACEVRSVAGSNPAPATDLENAGSELDAAVIQRGHSGNGVSSPVTVRHFV